MSKFVTRCLQVPKAGSAGEQCEDAWATTHNGSCLAIADGASDSFESGLWSRALVHHWVSGHPHVVVQQDLSEWLQGPIQAWKSGIRWGNLPWYAEEKARRGAHATFLALDIAEDTECGTTSTACSFTWRAVAVGDCCLVQCRTGYAIRTFPISRSSDFGTSPDLISTRLDYNAESLKNLTICEGECHIGDLLILATDTTASWLLHELEAGNLPALGLLDLDEEGFARRVDSLRKGRQVRNDDMTLVLLSLQSMQTSGIELRTLEENDTPTQEAGHQKEL